MTPLRVRAVGRLRAELLASGLSDWVSLAEVLQIISHLDLADTDDERQHLVLKTIEVLLQDGLMAVGELPAAGEPFPAWQPVDVALARLSKRFVDRYDQRDSWDYSIWLNLTEDGRRAAEKLAR